MSVEARRRPTFHVPGEPLMVTASPLEQIERLDMFAEMTGLTPDQMIVTPIVTTPIPLYPPGYPDGDCFGGGRKRWHNVRPEAMWHPLMWLPRRVALRYMIAESEDSMDDLSIESDDAWAVRVCMEMGAAGFYDTNTGEWLDILSAAGLDIEDPGDLGRVADWLDGADDPDLDGIDLGYVLDDEDDPDWAFSETALWMESLQMMMWATHSESLLDSARRLHTGCIEGVPADDPPEAFEIGEATEGEPLIPLELGRAQGSAEGIALFGSASFASLDPTEREWWDQIVEELQADDVGSTADLAEGVIYDMMIRLESLRDDFVPVIEETAATVGGIHLFAGQEEPAS